MHSIPFWIWAMLGAVACLAAAAAAYTIDWLRRGGKFVIIPWSNAGEHLPCKAELCARNESRTRDGSHLKYDEPIRCSLIFWQRLPAGGYDTLIVDALAGFSGISHVTVDCCLQDVGQRWMIDCGLLHLKSGRLDGPHFAPMAVCTGRAYARVDITEFIDVRQFVEDLQRMVSNTEIRHKGGRFWLSYILGTIRPDRVNCASLPGRCILNQSTSKLAAALRRALKERLTYGEMTPNNLARAMAICGASDEFGRCFSLAPVLDSVGEGFAGGVSTIRTCRFLMIHNLPWLFSSCKLLSSALRHRLDPGGPPD